MGSNKRLNSGQKFKFEIDYSLSLLELINKGKSSKEILQKEKAVGPNKIENFGFWLRIADLVNYDSGEFNLTDFGKSILKIRYNYDYVASLILYKLARGWDNGGHFYFSRLINDILYDYAFSLENIINIDEIKKEILTYKKEIGVKEKTIMRLTGQNLNTLSNPNTGFGKLGMVKKVEDNYEIYSYWPEPLICAYIIYDRWEEGSVAMKIDDIIRGHYNFGRIFFLDEETVMGILEDLQQMEYISIETIAGLNQIRINPKKSKDDILEAIVDEA